MPFHRKLSEVMTELGITQVQLSGLTGKSKGSISMYLSGKTVPPPEVQRQIAVSLGLPPDYFNRDDPPETAPVRIREGKIPRLTPRQAAGYLGVGVDKVYAGLKDRRFPWGYAIPTDNPKTGKRTWTFWINARRFAEVEMINIFEKENDDEEV